MIPTFNCAVYLRETLLSLLAQAPGPEVMQIEVIDDCSTKDDPAAVVRELSSDGRVTFYRQPANGGAVANFNTCIARSRGQLVHILHGDDVAEPGFYAEMDRMEQAHPDLVLYTCRSLLIDAQGTVQGESPRCPALETPCRTGEPLWYENYLPTPGVVIRRSFYEAQGGFLPSLCHVADWEMWWRALNGGGGIQTARPLVRYRMFAGNDTGRLARTGENLRDYLRLAQIIHRVEPSFDLPRFQASVAYRALEQTVRFETLGDTAAAAANMRLWRENVSGWTQLKMALRHPKAFFRRLRSPRT
jgi:glycosyltransferase involved in cell wall biosynthesis